MVVGRLWNVARPFVNGDLRTYTQTTEAGAVRHIYSVGEVQQ